MEKIRFLPFLAAALVIAGLVGARCVSFGALSLQRTETAAPVPTPVRPAPAIVEKPLSANAPMTSAVVLPAAIPVNQEEHLSTHDSIKPPVGSKEPKAATPAQDREPKWEVVYKDDFENAESVKKYAFITPPNRAGSLEWNEKYKGMVLRNNADWNGEVWAAIHKSLPGDLRVRFKAMCRKGESQVSIGIVFSVAGELQKEDGYFAEWAGGYTKLKKQNEQQAGENAPTPENPDRWVRLELQRVGAKITMFMEGQEVTSWTDEQPLQGPRHDLMSFYVWNETTLIKDLVIERNANDPTKPMPDDPASDDNMLRGIRGGGSSTPMEGADF